MGSNLRLTFLSICYRYKKDCMEKGDGLAHMRFSLIMPRNKLRDEYCYSSASSVTLPIKVSHFFEFDLATDTQTYTDFSPVDLTGLWGRPCLYAFLPFGCCLISESRNDLSSSHFSNVSAGRSNFLIKHSPIFAVSWIFYRVNSVIFNSSYDIFLNRVG